MADSLPPNQPSSPGFIFPAGLTHHQLAITASAKTGKIGDGKIWITNVERIIRIRTGELDTDAI